MKPKRLAGALVMMGLCFTLLPAMADVDVGPSATEAHDYLHKAMGLDADTPPTVPERLALLKKAQDVLDKIPPGHYQGHLKKAAKLIKDAMDELGTGDTDGATSSIRDADAEVRSLE